MPIQRAKLSEIQKLPGINLLKIHIFPAGQLCSYHRIFPCLPRRNESHFYFGVNAKCLGDGIILHRKKPDGLSAVVTQDVGRTGNGNFSGEKSILLIDIPFDIRHGGRVDITGKVSFGRQQVDILIVRKLPADDLYFHSLQVGDNHRGRDADYLGEALLQKWYTAVH